MGTKSKKKYKLLSLLLAFALVLTTCLPMSSMAAAESTDCVTVSSTAKTTGETVAGAKYEVELSKIFTDSDNHSLTYTLESTDLGGYTQIKDGILYFTENKAGDYEVKVKATCSSGKSALYTLKMTVKAAEEGTKDQYNYNETDADKVTVWVTMSNDGVPLMGNDDGNTKLSHVKVTVPYFDLGKYRLDRFKRCHTAVDPNMGHKGAYIDTVAVERPTYFHLLIWLTERYYLGLPEERCGKGTSGVFENTDTTTVNTIFGEKAYTSNGLGAFELKDGTATATSMLINNLWGHDMNFMYLRNHVYPLMDAGWGATADYILLSDDDVLDIALFTDWTFYQRGSFNKFDKEVYTAAPGADMTFSTLKYDTVSPSDGGAGTFTKMDKLNIGLYNADWEKVSDVNIDGVDGEYYIDALPVVEGTYYLLGLDPLVGTKNSYTACYAPAVAEVDIKGENPYEGMPFTDIYYMDGDTKVQLKKIAQEDSLNSSGYPDFKNLPAYKVTIPESLVGTTPTVYVTIPLKDGKKLSSSIYTYSRTTGGGYGSDSYTVTNDGNNYTIALKVTDTYIGDAADYMVPEVNSSWEAVVGLTFVGGDISDKPEPEDPYKGMPFTDIYYMDGDTKVQLKKIAQEDSLNSSGYPDFKNLPAYKVTIPESLVGTTPTVYVTIPLKDGKKLSSSIYTYSRTTGGGYGSDSYTVTNDGNNYTIALKVTDTYIGDAADYMVPEVNSSWEAVVGLTFVGGNIGDESEDPFKDAPFTDLYYMDGEKKVQLPVFEKEEEGLSDSNMQMSNVPAYKVTVPESLADTGLDVYITYPDTQTLVKYAYLYKNGAVDYMTYPGPTVAVDAETNTLKITVTKDYIDANGTYVLAEDGKYQPFMGFGFVSGDITPSKPSDGKVSGVTLDQKNLTMPRWSTATLTATIQPADAKVKTVKWSSSDDSIVSVNKGVLTAHQAGEADITVTTVQNKKTATCHVTVTDSDKPTQDAKGIYQISTAKELLWLANEVNTSVKGTVINATLTQNIDLSGLDGTTRARESWPAIGISSAHPYTGTFDGAGYTVQNLYGDYQATGEESVYGGLFGITNNATIKNVTVTGTISAASDGYNASVNIGGICGSASSTTIENCHNQVVLTGGTGRLDSVGGIAGTLYSGSITSCSNKAAITGRYAAGIASSASGSISECWNEGTITGEESYMTGGIVAEANMLSITNCNNVGSVTATGQSTMPYTRVGGICGNVNRSMGRFTCQNCYNTGALSASGNGVELYGVGPVSSETSAGKSDYINCFYTNTDDAITPVLGVQPISQSEEKDVAAAFSEDVWKDSCPLPVLKGQTATAHKDTDGDGNCDACGKVMNSTSAYTISAAQNQTINLSNEVKVTLTVGAKQETTYNAYALKVTYDADLLKFEKLVKVEGSTQNVSDDGQGTLTITGYGADCRIGTNNIDLIFVGKATGGAKVKIESANIDKQANANAKDAPAAAITSAIAFVNITNEYPVTFDNTLFTGNSTVKAGENYTLTVLDKNYNYTVTATMGGESVEVTSGNGGIYFYVKNVTGPLVFIATKGTPKTYTVIADDKGTGRTDLTLSSEKATYGEDYAFTVNKEAGYGYTVSAKAEVYQGIANKEVPLAQEEGDPFTKDGKTYTPYTYKIAGTNIVSNFVIKVDKEIDDNQWTQITFTGEGSADVVNGPDQKGLNNKPFQFKLNKSEGFEYTVKENGIELQADEDGNYTIPALRMTGTALTVTVEKKGELTIVAKEYLKLGDSKNENGKTMWLITATGAVNDGKTLAYDTNTMDWSAKYNAGKGAYAYLVIYDNEIADQNGQKQAVTKDLVEAKAKEKIQESGSPKVTLAYDGDVNGTGKLDINDAQLVYNMYNAMYEDFDTVYVKKFLEADMNGDGTVNVSDAAAVVKALAE